MFNPADDPLGNALMQRAREHRLRWEQEQQAANPYFHLYKPINTLPDDRWGGMFQAMEEAGVSGVADNSVGIKRGMWSGGGATHPTFDPRYQRSAGSTAADVVDKQGEHVGFNFQPRPSRGIGSNVNPGFSGIQSDDEIGQFGRRPRPPAGGSAALRGLMGAR